MNATVIVPSHAWETFPFLRPTYTAFEDAWRNAPVLGWMRANSWFPLAATALYVLMVLCGQRVMEGFKPFKLVGPLAYWNLALSVFSFMGAFRTVPIVLHLLANLGVEQMVCTPVEDLKWAEHGTGLWTCAFILSKFPELVDTGFIVLRKKPLIFLHWYHHATVLLYCWHSYVVQSPSGLPFIAMNYSVHALMYLYYFAKAKRLKFIDAVPPMSITGAQIVQMVGGIYICVMSLHYRYLNGEACKNSEDNILLGLAMYFSYFLLFMNFFLQRYCFKGAPKKKSAVRRKEQ